MFPRKKNRFIFGAWYGNQVSDNPKGIYDYIKKNNIDVETIWISRTPEKYADLGCKVLKRNSLKSLYYILTSEVAFFNQGYFDLCTFNLLGRAYKVQLWHGVPWKRICEDALGEMNTVEKLTHWFVKRLAVYDLYIAPSDSYALIAPSAFATKADKILKVGQPRNDVLFNEEFCKDAHRKLLSECGLPEDSDSRIVVYMPTFRDKKSNSESFGMDEIGKLVAGEADDKNYIVIEKSHYQSMKRDGSKEFSSSRIFIKPTIDAATLLGGADMLITDYSSCFFDFGIRRKPIIHYLYDYEYYKNKDRGIYYEAEDVVGGRIVTTREDLVAAIGEGLDNPSLNKDKRDRLFEKYITYETPDNSKIIYEYVINHK